jgi:hypothetical protein
MGAPRELFHYILLRVTPVTNPYFLITNPY